MLNRKRICGGGAVLLLIGLGAMSGCDGVVPPTPEPEVTPADTFPTSLHGNREGKRLFYEGTADEPGFFTMTDIAYDTLPCKDCHAATYADGTEVDSATYVPGCADCHADPDNPTADIPESVCTGCHSRIKTERSLADGGVEHMTDVHRDAGMTCMECHNEVQMHGDGNVYASAQAADLPRPACDDCHTAGGIGLEPPATVIEHTLHLANIDCSACHVQSVISCDSCHFETQVEQDFKRFYGPPPRHGYVYLVNGVEGKVTTASSQSLTFGDQAFITIAPFYAHTVSQDGRQCGDCHGSEKVTEYAETGTIRVTEFTEDEGLIGPTGVIPIPFDWKTSMLYDYARYVPEDLTATDPAFQADLWEKLEPAEELRQMLFATPLTAEQMEKLE